VFLWHGLENAFRMAYEVWWALVLGFGLSAIVQSFVPAARLRGALGGSGPREAVLATGLGAASSSCSYAAIAIAKSLFEKGASIASAMAFQFASTNLVFELGIVLWVLIGWKFTLAEFVGGLILIAVMWLALRTLVSPAREERARETAERADGGHAHGSASGLAAVARNFRHDWHMLGKEIVAGFLIAGFVALLPAGFFSVLFLTHGPALLRELENVIVGPLVAVLAFVCSIGNVPLAAVLWSSGVSFAGVVAFLFADLLIPPILLYYRKVYGRLAGLLVAVMCGSIVVAALAVSGLFSLAGLVPSERPALPSVADKPITWNTTTVLDLLALAVFAALFVLSSRYRAAASAHSMSHG
jgi:uncharacterized protein